MSAGRGKFLPADEVDGECHAADPDCDDVRDSERSGARCFSGVVNVWAEEFVVIHAEPDA